MKNGSITANELDDSKYIEWATKNRIPINGNLEITNICNFKCVHCYVTNAKNQKPTFLSYDVIKSVIDEVFEMGCKIITLTGGECLLHPDFEKIYTYIYEKGISINVFTNASLITDSTISLFKKYRPRSVEVSIYGSSEKTYKEVTKFAHYKDVINGIKLLRDGDINLVLKIVVLKQNEHELDEMKRLACEYSSNPVRISNDLMPSYDFSLDVLNNSSNILLNTNTKNKPRIGEKAFNCKAGRSFFCIDYNGNVTLCSFCSFSKMSLKEHSFHDIWESFGKFIDIPISKDSKCHECVFLNECTNCPARTWMHNKKLGLYPIPKCKFNTHNKSEGVSCMNGKKIPIGAYMNFNGNDYFRTSEGIAVEESSNCVIAVPEKEEIELITFERGKKVARFWKIEDEIYALAEMSHITIPKDTVLKDIYLSKNYEGVYVKYTTCGNCGILYISETEVSVVFHHELSYIDISFENDHFYAEKKEDEPKYFIFDEALNQIQVNSSKCKMFGEKILYYDANKIYFEFKEIEIPNGIESVEIIYSNDITFIKVINNKGIYYYTKDFSLLFGPIKEDLISSITKTCCFVFEYSNNQITKVFIIHIKDDTYICKEISCKDGIIMNTYKYRDYYNYAQEFFATNDNKIYACFNCDFKCLIEDVEFDANSVRYTVSAESSTKVNIVAYKDLKPVFLLKYNLKEQKTEKTHIFDEVILDENTQEYVCFSKGESIFVIDSFDGSVYIETTGIKYYNEKCYLCYFYNYRLKLTYFFVQSNDSVIIYRAEDHKRI